MGWKKYHRKYWLKSKHTPTPTPTYTEEKILEVFREKDIYTRNKINVWVVTRGEKKNIRTEDKWKASWSGAKN